MPSLVPGLARPGPASASSRRNARRESWTQPRRSGGVIYHWYTSVEGSRPNGLTSRIPSPKTTCHLWSQASPAPGRHQLPVEGMPVGKFGTHHGVRQVWFTIGIPSFEGSRPNGLTLRIYMVPSFFNTWSCSSPWGQVSEVSAAVSGGRRPRWRPGRQEGRGISELNHRKSFFWPGKCIVDHLVEPQELELSFMDHRDGYRRRPRRIYMPSLGPRPRQTRALENITKSVAESQSMASTPSGEPR